MGSMTFERFLQGIENGDQACVEMARLFCQISDSFLSLSAEGRKEVLMKLEENGSPMLIAMQALNEKSPCNAPTLQGQPLISTTTKGLNKL